MQTKNVARSIASRLIAFAIAISSVAALAPQSIVGTAMAAATKYAVRAAAGEGGSISPSGEIMVKEGGSQSFDIATQPGFVVDYILINGRQTPGVTSFTLSNITQETTVFVVFRDTVPMRTFTIKATAGPGGSISESGKVSVYKGDDCSFTITPDAGYRIKEVLTDGGSIGAQGWFMFNDVRSDHTISATFERITTSDLRITEALAKNVTSDGATVVVKIKGSSKYTLYWETQGSSGFKTIKDSKNKTSYKLTGLKGGTTYNVRCVVKDDRGNDVDTATVTFTTTGKAAGGSGGGSTKGDYPCQGTIKGGSVNVRSEASPTSKSLTILYKGDAVTVVGFVASADHAPGFYKVKWGSGYAYIATNYVELKR